MASDDKSSRFEEIKKDFKRLGADTHINHRFKEFEKMRKQYKSDHKEKQTRVVTTVKQ